MAPRTLRIVRPVFVFCTVALSFGGALPERAPGPIPAAYGFSGNAAFQRPENVLRAVIEYDHGAFRLQKLIPLQMVLPPSDADPGRGSPGGASGFWIEVWSGRGEVLYRKIAEDPIPYHTEGSELAGPGSAIERSDHFPERRVFAVLIPDLPEADRLVFFGSVLANLPQASAASQVEINRARVQAARQIGSVQLERAQGP